MALRLSRALLSVAKAPAVKLTTGITGLDVIPNAREVLLALYEKTLVDVAVMPPEVPYRQVVEKTTRHRMDIVSKHTSIVEIEAAIGCGQVEELVDQAKGELILIPEYASWRLWEAPPASLDDDEFSDVFDDLEFVDPDAACSPGVRDLMLKKRAEREAQRRAEAAAAAAAAAAAQTAAGGAAKTA